jgi:hypothetical protein
MPVRCVWPCCTWAVLRPLEAMKASSSRPSSSSPTRLMSAAGCPGWCRCTATLNGAPPGCLPVGRMSHSTSPKHTTDLFIKLEAGKSAGPSWASALLNKRQSTRRFGNAYVAPLWHLACLPKATRCEEAFSHGRASSLAGKGNRKRRKQKRHCKYLIYSGVCSKSAPSWARTRDPLINSQML